MNPKHFTNREIELIEQMGVMKRLLEIHKLLQTCLVARCGGEVKLTHDELENARKTYILIENVQAENYMADVHMRVRLRSPEDDLREHRREYE